MRYAHSIVYQWANNVDEMMLDENFKQPQTQTNIIQHHPTSCVQTRPTYTSMLTNMLASFEQVLRKDTNSYTILIYVDVSYTKFVYSYILIFIEHAL